MKVKAWWFEPTDGALGYHDGRKPRKGITHKVDGPVALCQHGLHASESPLDALAYAGSCQVWRVEISGDIVRGNDKLCGTERTYLWRLDATETLHKFARLCALDVMPLWDAPDDVQRFLRTGDPSLRDAAWNAAAAVSAAWDAWDAAWDAWNAAWDACNAASAAWDAWDAASAARNAAQTAQTAAGAAARGRQSKRLHRLLLEQRRAPTPPRAASSLRGLSAESVGTQ